MVVDLSIMKHRVILGSIIGGLGNQMFQYAFYQYVSCVENRALYCNLSDFKKYQLHQGYELEKVFELEINNKGSNKLYRRLQFLRIFNKLLWKMFQKNLTFGGQYFVERYFALPDSFHKSKRVTKFVDGYFQTYKYIHYLEKKEIFTFKFRHDISTVEAKYLDGETVSIHVRGGDYTNNTKDYKLFGNVCDSAYYQRALNYIHEKVVSPRFLVFTDDRTYAKAILPDGFKFEICDVNRGEDSFRDMLLMSHCSHNVIANSSFSWWGAYLNKNPAKEVVAPSNWFNDKNYKQNEIVPKMWKRL